MTPGFLHWPKRFQIRACADLTYLFSKEISFSEPQNFYSITIYGAPVMYLVAGDTGVDQFKSLMDIVPIASGKAGEGEDQCKQDKNNKLWEVNFSSGKSE